MRTTTCNRNGRKEKAKALWKSYEAQKNHGKSIPQLAFFNEGRSKGRRLNERSRDIRRRRRLVDQDRNGDYVLLWEFHVSQP